MGSRMTVMTPPTFVDEVTLESWRQAWWISCDEEGETFPQSTLRVSRQIYMIGTQLEQPSGASREEWALASGELAGVHPNGSSCLSEYKRDKERFGQWRFRNINALTSLCLAVSHTCGHTKRPNTTAEKFWNCPHGLHTSMINRKDVLSIKLRQDKSKREKNWKVMFFSFHR